MNETETVVDNTSVEPSAEVTQQETENIPEFTLDDLMNLTVEDNPLFTDDAHYKGVRPINEYLHHLPPDLQKNLANLRAMATRKTQELAEVRKQLEMERAQVQKERELLVNSPALTKLKELTQEAGAEFDPFSEESVRVAAQREAAKMLEETFAPLREQIEIQQAQARAESFVAQHPDAKEDPELRGMIVEALQRKEDLSLEDAYWLCKGKLLETRNAHLTKQAQVAREQNRQNLFKTSTGASTGAASKPKFKTAEEAMLYHMSKAGIKESPF